MSSVVASREILRSIEARRDAPVPIEAIRSWIRFIHYDILSASDGNRGGSLLPFGLKPIRLAWDLRRLWRILDRSQNENDVLLVDAMERFTRGASDWEAPTQFIEIIDKLGDLADAARSQMAVEEGIDFNTSCDASPTGFEEHTAAIELSPFAEFRAKRIADRAAYDAEWQRIWGVTQPTLAHRNITEAQRQATYARFECAEAELKRKYAHLWPATDNDVRAPAAELPPGTPVHAPFDPTQFDEAPQRLRSSADRR
jgi:hypothetical protein